MIMRRVFIAVILLAAASRFVAAAEGANGNENVGDTFTLEITVTGLTPNDGQVVASLFDEKKKYLKKSVSTLRESANGTDKLILEFTDLAIGEYAVSVFYDLDSDGELDTGFMRIPKEPIGFSNNARGKFGPAKWKHTSFRVDHDLQMTIHVAPAISKK